MPLKGRSQPCDNPLKDRDTLPEYNWRDGSRLCFQCRALASKKAKSREDDLRGVQILVAQGLERAQDLQDSSENQSFSQMDTSQNHSTDSQMDSSEPTHAPSAPLLMETDSGPSGSPLPSPSSTIYLTPTRPSTSQNLYPQLSPTTSTLSPAPSLQSAAALQFTSPSVAGTQYSNASGSVFNDEETAKFELTEFLKQLGVKPPDKHAKTRPKRLLNIMSEAMAAFKNKFMEYLGRPIPEPPCSCQFCEIIIAAVKAKLPETKSKKEKYLLLSSLPPHVSIKEMVNEFGVSWYMARKASKLRSTEGPFSFPEWKTTGKPISDEVKEIVKDFYLSDDNSKADPTAVYSINVKDLHGKRDRKERRIMHTNLKDSFQEFKKVHSDVKIGISKFAELRPKNVKWPGQTGVHFSCLCVYHENFKLILEGLKVASMEAMEEEFSTDATAAAFTQKFDDYKEFISYMLCDPPTDDCYLGYCSDCPNVVNYDKILSFSEGNQITYKYWEKNDLMTRIDEYSIFRETFPEILAKFILHDFIYRQQKEYIKMLKNGPLDNGTSAVLTVDFGENYSFIVQNAIAGYHWNNSQATIHPFVIYTTGSTPGKPEYKTYFVISDDLGHDANAFHCFRVQVIQRIKRDFPQIKHIEYVGDGASSQYKNGFNIANLLYHEDDFNLTARWNFTCTSHGKCTCDAMSSVVKRTIRLRSLSTKNKAEDAITTPVKMFEVAEVELSSPKLEFLFVTKADVDFYRESLKTRYAKLKKIKGTRKWHYLAVGEGKRLITKQFGSSTASQTIQVIEEEGLEEMETENEIATLQPIIGEFYAILIGKTYQVGLVVEILPEKEIARLRMMKKAGKAGVSLSWPVAEKFEEVDFSSIIMKLSAPTFIENRLTYRLLEDDVTAIRDALK